jgi:uncharacterized protein YkwD
MRIVASLLVACACLLTGVVAVPAAALAGPARLDHRERAMLHGINGRRARHGLAAVRASRPLARAADYHSWEMLDADYFSHVSRDGSPFDQRIRRFARKRALGETLAYVGGRCRRATARRMVRMWMESPGHRAILLSSRYRRVGLGMRAGRLGSTKVCMATADFGSRR